MSRANSTRQLGGHQTHRHPDTEASRSKLGRETKGRVEDVEVGPGLVRVSLAPFLYMITIDRCSERTSGYLVHWMGGVQLWREYDDRNCLVRRYDSPSAVSRRDHNKKTLVYDGPYAVQPRA
jgi:hypothetical protein